ncbi:MAG: peptidylprolyl isomerase [Planctomycetes bacterium]|nr:peptidylprolyl isomerase [Planctomycetota bacterium]
MPMPTNSYLPTLLLLAAVTAPIRAQEAVQTPDRTQTPAPKPHFVVRHYPADRDAPIAVVGERVLTLGNLVDHIDEQHHPGFREALEKVPTVQAMLQSDLIAPWVRQFADIEALRQLSADKEIDQAALQAAQSERLRVSFQAWLDTYVANRKAQGRPAELSQQRVNLFLADFQLRQGLGAELQGWLDYLEKDDYSRAQLQQFFQNNARAFGGQVKISHILVQNRDAGTGILLDEEAYGRAAARLADIKARLRPDGSNFEEVARLYSEDTRTAKEGGELDGIRRFDEGLPAALCRAAWQLRDGELSGVVETQYGWHLVKRLDFAQHMFILFTDDAIPSIREVMRRSRQEDLLFAARAKSNLQLKL